MSYELKDKNSSGSQWVRLSDPNSPQKGLVPGGGSGLVTIVRGLPNGAAGAIATGARLSATGTAAASIGATGAGATAGGIVGVAAAGLAGGIGTFGAAAGGTAAALAASSQTLNSFRAISEANRGVAFTGQRLADGARAFADYKRLPGAEVKPLWQLKMEETKPGTEGLYLRETLRPPVKTDPQKRRRSKGICRCPGQVDKGNNRCGGRAAWWRPAGESPNCSGVPSATGNKTFGKAMLAALGEKKASAYKIPL